MEDNERYPIKEEWEEYYQTLEAIRRTGVVNMWGAHPYLRACFTDRLSDEEAQDVLCSWIHNYDKLNEKYGWRK